MFKRLRWMTLGAGMGAGLTLWARRTVRQRVDRYRPGGFAREVQAAITEGRDAMHAREAEIRARLDRRSRR
jgi:hypothetical protein